MTVAGPEAPTRHPGRAVARFGAARLAATLGLCLLAWACVAAACVMIGSTGSFGWPGDPYVLRVRVESVLLASLVGAALAAAGATYQALLGNPLADPYLLGTSSGAMLASYLWTLPAGAALLGGAGGEVLSALGQQAAAFAGAVAAVGTALLIAGARGRLEPVTLVLVGVIVNAVCAAVFLLLNAIVKDPAAPGGPLLFLVGGLQTHLTGWQAGSAAVLIVGGWMALASLGGLLNAGAMRDAEATGLGVRIMRLRWAGLAIASLVTAAAVAVSGPIGFVGLICPHLARLLVGVDVRRVLPVATALGAGLLCSADAAARWFSSFGAVGTYLPVGVITSLLGGPFFLLLLLRRGRTP